MSRIYIKRGVSRILLFRMIIRENFGSIARAIGLKFDQFDKKKISYFYDIFLKKQDFQMLSMSTIFVLPS